MRITVIKRGVRKSFKSVAAAKKFAGRSKKVAVIVTTTAK